MAETDTVDDLSAPLGQKPARKRRFRLPFSGTQAITAVLGLILIVFLGFVLFNDNPMGGEPVARVAIRAPGTGPAARCQGREPRVCAGEKSGAEQQDHHAGAAEGAGGGRRDGGGQEGLGRPRTVLHHFHLGTGPPFDRGDGRGGAALGDLDLCRRRRRGRAGGCPGRPR